MVPFPEPIFSGAAAGVTGGLAALAAGGLIWCQVITAGDSFSPLHLNVIPRTRPGPRK